MNRRLLRIYLNDHRTLAHVALAVAERSRSSNRGTPLGDALESIVSEQRKDQAELEAIMGRLRIPRDRFKAAAALVAERAGRLKLNGQLTGYSPLSRLIELDGLRALVDAKLGLWQALGELSGGGIDANTLARLIDRAHAQRELLDKHRPEAARAALDA
jgi:hypothetical protein